jgi:hypothetical protein
MSSGPELIIGLVGAGERRKSMSEADELKAVIERASRNNDPEWSKRLERQKYEPSRRTPSNQPKHETPMQR